MNMKLYRIVVRGRDGDRTIRVLSPTDAQAADAAAPIMRDGDTIHAIDEETDPDQTPDAGPPKTQAHELASVTPGDAAAD